MSSPRNRKINSQSPSPTNKKKKLQDSSLISNKELFSQLNLQSKIKPKEINYNISMLPKLVQFKLNQNKILLINLTSCMTELCRLLITAGFNIYLQD